MAELKNSRRRLDKVTYTPLTLAEDGRGGGALETAAAVGGLGLISGEARAAVDQAAERTVPALLAMEELTSAPDAAGKLAASAALAKLATATLTSAVDRIRAQRDTTTGSVFTDLEALIREYRSVQRHNQENANTNRLEDRVSMLEERMLEGREFMEPAAPTHASAPGVASLYSSLARTHVLGPAGPAWSSAFIGPTLGALLQPALPPVVTSRLGSDLAADAWSAVTWADSQAPDRARQFTAAAIPCVPAELRSSAWVLLLQGLPFLVAQAARTVTVKSALTRRQLQPIGVLHLEELVMTPLEVERGELLYSLPLAPNEKATVAHKEWSLQEEEYSRFVQDYFQNYSERGVAEKSDIAVSSKSQSEHTKSLSMSQPATPGSTTLASAVDATVATTDVAKETQSQEKSRRDTREITEKASALAIRDQRVSFTVTTVSGREDFTARLYENTHTDKVMVVDYYRRMRRWRNQLFRTGIRLTYDVVLPDPGRRLRERRQALAALDAEIAAPFEFNLGVPLPSGLSVYSPMASAYSADYAATSLSDSMDFDTASVDQLIGLARQYGVTLPPAPETLTAVEEMKEVIQKPVAPDTVVSLPLKIPTIPATHRATRVWLGARVAGPADATIEVTYWSHGFTVSPGDNFVQRAFNIRPSDGWSRTLTVSAIASKGAIGQVRGWVDLTPTPEAWREWRSQVWALLRQAALTRYNDKREALRVRRAALQRELDAPDTLALRRMEREQIMHMVLEWLFPDFGQNPAATQSLAPDKSANWQTVLEYGEYIKFVHEAIDWDRILVLLYPYFWDRPNQHGPKLYLDHPDALHREFLRAGAARVILAIKPDSEEQVVRLLDQGELGKLAPAPRFARVIGAVQAAEEQFREKREAALVVAEGDPDVDPPVSYGDEIGHWIDWTPTSALDMEVTLKPTL